MQNVKEIFNMLEEANRTGATEKFAAGCAELKKICEFWWACELPEGTGLIVTYWFNDRKTMIYLETKKAKSDFVLMYCTSVIPATLQ